MKIEITNEAVDLILETVDYDLIRYNVENDTKLYEELLSLHMNKVKFLISKGKFKTQDELINFLIKYRDSFKSFATPNNLYY